MLAGIVGGFTLLFLAQRMARSISPLWFYRILYGGMLLTGVKLLWDGFGLMLFK